MRAVLLPLIPRTTHPSHPSSSWHSHSAVASLSAHGFPTTITAIRSRTTLARCFPNSVAPADSTFLCPPYSSFAATQALSASTHVAPISPAARHQHYV